MKKLLLTGFEPFLQHPINPTEMIVKALDGKKVGNYEITSLLLPVDYDQAPGKLLNEIEKQQPDAIISLGLAAGRDAITPERVAINVRDGEPDNRGTVLEDASIEEDAPVAYLSTLPIRKMIKVLNEVGFPAKISNSAGTYLCNNVMYSTLHLLAKQNKHIPAGFIHIPASHKLVVNGNKSYPSWSDRDLVDAMNVIISSLD